MYFHHIGREDPLLWLLLVFVIAMTGIPILVGAFVIYFIQRLFSKNEKREYNFLWLLIIGWLLCGPIYYFMLRFI